MIAKTRLSTHKNYEFIEIRTHVQNESAGPGMSWWVYMVQCSDDSLYTGITTDLERRLKEHNDAATGARYTRARRPVKLVYSEPADSRSEASKREHRIKQLSQAQKLGLIINQDNST